MSLVYLRDDDFYLRDKKLCLQRKGLVMIFMFRPTGCEHCRLFMPIYKTLPDHFRGVDFACCSALECNQMRSLSYQSTVPGPIDRVPKFFLYLDGNFVTEYTGERNAQGIVSFLQVVIQRLKATVAQQSPNQGQRAPPSQQQQQPQQQAPPPASLLAPAYNTGSEGYVSAADAYRPEFWNAPESRMTGGYVTADNAYNPSFWEGQK